MVMVVFEKGVPLAKVRPARRLERKIFYLFGSEWSWNWTLKGDAKGELWAEFVAKLLGYLKSTGARIGP